MAYRVVSDYTANVSENANIKVFVRARPPDDAVAEEQMRRYFQVAPDQPGRIALVDESNKAYGEHAFQFDRVFWTNTDQQQVFQEVCRQQVDHVLRGYNSCCFAYGQTGSGKTYSMFGENSSGELRGMIPRSVEYLFERTKDVKDVSILVSFIEIYCGRIRDLGNAYLSVLDASERVQRTVSTRVEKTSDLFLRREMRRSESFSRGGTRGDSARALSGDGGADCNGGLAASPAHGDGDGAVEDAPSYEEMDYEIHEDADGNVFVKNAAMIHVNSEDDVMAVIREGLRLRATHETKMNAVSSRSHTVFTVTVLQQEPGSGQTVNGKLNLVDLAGSERLKKSESEGIRLKEATYINSSLTALGKVVVALDPSSNQTHIPYRDSKLTRMLQNSLGGNSFTTVLATIHPDPAFANECLSTLQFANRCRLVQNHPRVSYVGGGQNKDARIKALLEEINALRRKLAAARSLVASMGGNLDAELGEAGGELVAHHAEAAKVAEATNLALHDILTDMGIEVKVAEDGRLELPGGKVVGMEQPVVDSIDGEAGGVGAGGLGTIGGIGTAPLAAGLRNAPADVKALVDHLKRERVILRNKIAAMKDDFTRQESELKDEAAAYRNKLREQMTSAHHQQQTLQAQLQAQSDTVESTKRSLTSAFTDQVNAIMGRSEELVRAHAARARETQASAELVASQRPDPETMRQHGFMEGKEHQDVLRSIEASHAAEKEHLTQQYEFWLNRKAEEAERFVSDFNKFRTSLQQRLTSTEEELVRVYHHANSLNFIVDGVDGGAYPVRQSTNPTRVVACVPAAHRPPEPQLLAQESVPLDPLTPDGHGVSPNGMAAGIQVPLWLPVTRSVLLRRATEERRTATLAHAAETTLGVSAAVRHGDTRPASPPPPTKVKLRTRTAGKPPLQGLAAAALRHSGATTRGGRPASSSRAWERRQRRNQHEGSLTDRSLSSASGPRHDEDGATSSDEEHSQVEARVFGDQREQHAHPSRHRQEVLSEVSALMARVGEGSSSHQKIKDFLTNRLPSKVTEWIMAELRSSDTVQYVATLESKLSRKEELIARQTRAFNELKVAYEALQRAKAQREKKTHHRHGQRPRSGRRLASSASSDGTQRQGGVATPLGE